MPTSKMSEYGACRGGKLRLKKGAVGGHFKKRKRSRKKGEHAEEDERLTKHGRWKKVSSIVDMGDSAIVETHTGGYIQALDSGYFVVGESIEDEESPDPSEILTVVQLSEIKVALKTGYGRYVGVNTAGELIGKAEAIGPREMWEPVFEEGKLALCACNHRFLTVTADDKLMAVSEKAREREMLTMYCECVGPKKAKTDREVEDELSSRDMESFEVGFVKKFQSFSDHKLRVSESSRDSLQRARQEGKLHEALLDRREKMKADRYCK